MNNHTHQVTVSDRLNESPSEKEGKSMSWCGFFFGKTLPQ